MTGPVSFLKACRLLVYSCLAVTVAVGVAAACGAAPVARSSRPSLLSLAGGAPAYPSPARWRYHPKSAAQLAARMPVDQARVLLAGDRGERWLVTTGPKTATARAAAQLAPEELISILRLGDGGWLFVGKSGTGYEAREPLGPFVRSSTPLDALVRISAAASALVGVRENGTLVRSVDAGASWQAVGPGDTRFADVAVTRHGRGLALAVPEALWRSRDGGANWEQLGVDSVGAIGLQRDRDAGLVVQGMLDYYKVDAETGRLEPLQRTLVAERYSLPARPPRGPAASALVTGRATFVSGHYLELDRDERERQLWRLWYGTADAGLRSVKLQLLKGCRVVEVAGYDRWITLACSRTSRGFSTQRFVFYRSEDRGKTWHAEGFSAEGRAEQLAMAVGADGALLVTGVCLPRSAKRGCRPQGVLYRRKAPADAGAPDAADDATAAVDAPQRDEDDSQDATDEARAGTYQLAGAATPALRGSADAVAFSTDGKTAYVVGRRTKNQAFAMYVSDDAGRTFEATEIEQLHGLSVDDEYEAEEYEGVEAEEPPSRYYGQQPSDIEALAAAEDGSVAVVVRVASQRVLVVTDDRGRVLSVSRPPGQDVRVGAVGTRALAFSVATRRAWESVDGGARWEPIGRLPLDLCPDRDDCQSSVYCHLGGCVIGDELSRLGWQGQADADQGTLSPPERHGPPLFDSKLRTPFSCALDEVPWRELSGVNAAPTADQAAIGDAVWFMPRHDDEDASVDVILARAGKRAAFDTVPLLRRVAHADLYAYGAWMQIEGAAAIRYPVVNPAAGEARLKNVEVAWLNLIEGRIGRARIPDAGRLLAGDYVSSDTGADSARPDLLSVGSGGVFVRIHQSPGSAQETLFLDGRSIERIPAVTWPDLTVSNAHREMAHVDGVHVPLLLVGAGTALVRARRGDAGWVFEAVATGLEQPGSFGLSQEGSIAYVEGRSGRHVMSYDATGEYHRGVVFPFRGRGAVVGDPVAVAMQSDTAEQPRHCSAQQRASTARVVVPFQPGTRHPVSVVDLEEPMRVMLTGQAVMHGTPAVACVAAFEAEIVGVDGGPEPQGERAILPLDDLEHSWLFRVVRDETEDEARVEYRTMSCRFDPSVVAPREVYEAPGTRVRRP